MIKPPQPKTIELYKDDEEEGEEEEEEISEDDGKNDEDFDPTLFLEKPKIPKPPRPPLKIQVPEESPGIFIIKDQFRFSQTGASLFKCHTCDLILKARWSVILHIIRMHDSGTPFIHTE